MKKIVISVIVAAALGIGGGVTAVMMNRHATADKNTALPEVKTGKYYLNGDKNSGTYINVTENSIVIKTEGDALAYFENVCREAGFTEEEVEINAPRYLDDYCTERKYVLSVTGAESVPYMLLTHYDEKDAVNTTDHRLSGSGYKFDGQNKISLSLVGEFIYVE